jgi:tetratricopeptide (TPR) repeat protein
MPAFFLDSAMAAEQADIPSPVESEVNRIRAIMEKGRFAEALAAAEAQSRLTPDNRDVNYVIAVCLRYLQRVPEALAVLERLEQTHPGFSRLYQERGHCYVALKDAEHAIAAYQKAVNRNPALPGSWSKLAALYRMTGDAENARIAASHVEITAKLAPEVIAATGLFSDGDLVPAEKIIRAYLLRKGDDVEAMRLLARIALELDVLNDADVLLSAVVELAPDYKAARYDYARALLRRHKHAAALEQLEILLKQEPDNRVYKTTYATTWVGLGDHEKALALYRELLSDAPRAADLHLSVAHTLKTLGRTQESIAAYRMAAESRPNFGDAYWSLANLKTYRFTDDELATMIESEASPKIGLVDRYHMCFALGKALEDRGDYERSYRYYERGNALRKSESPYQAASVEKNTELQISVCTREFFAARAGVGAPDPDPIFIVGLPRSGSTLLEQILASHSAVEGTMELSDIAAAVVDLEGHNKDPDNRRYPAVLAELAPGDFRRLGEKYIADTRVYRSGRPFFIDKMPNNFRHIGFIHLILPNAKIIDARREPMACCFSNFKQLFAAGQDFTYSIEDIARYYRTYVELMDHWDAVLPGRVLRVQHEAVVEDLEGNVRRILDYCGLAFEPACLEFYKTERSVRTASSEQVRQPIFKEGLDQWRHFEPWLGPLKDALGDLVKH